MQCSSARSLLPSAVTFRSVHAIFTKVRIFSDFKSQNGFQRGSARDPLKGRGGPPGRFPRVLQQRSASGNRTTTKHQVNFPILFAVCGVECGRFASVHTGRA